MDQNCFTNKVVNEWNKLSLGNWEAKNHETCMSVCVYAPVNVKNGKRTGDEEFLERCK